MSRPTITILHGHRPALALGLPWHVDIVAMVVGKVQQRSGMTSVENGLKDAACGITKIEAEQRVTHEERAPNWKRFDKHFFELLEACQWTHDRDE
jgi:hypothetical protein